MCLGLGSESGISKILKPCLDPKYLNPDIPKKCQFKFMLHKITEPLKMLFNVRCC